MKLEAPHQNVPAIWKKDVLILFALAALASVLATPLFVFGIGPHVHDGVIHLKWSSQMAETFGSENLYPRWLPGLNGGLGAPTFFYYPVLPYLAALALKLGLAGIGLQFHDILPIGTAFALAASGIFMYVLLRHLVNLLPAIAGSVLYMTAPYILGVDVYTRFAYTEIWGCVFMPAVLLGALLIVRKRSSGFYILTFSYAALIYSHLPLTLIFSVFPPLLSIVCARTHAGALKARFTILASVLLAMLLGSGLAAPYLVPALQMQDSVSMHELNTTHHYNDNFFFGEVGLASFDLGHTFKKSLYPPFLTTFVIGILAAASTARTTLHPSIRSAITFFSAMLLASAFMAMPCSDFIWRIFGKLQVIQFPWRFCALLSLASAGLVAFQLQNWNQPFDRKRKSALLFQLVALMVSMGHNFESVSRFSDSPKFEKTGMDDFLLDAPEYLPSTARQNIGKTISKIRAIQPDAKSPGIAILTKDGAGELSLAFPVLVDIWRSRKIQLSISMPAPREVQLTQLFYPGWKAWVNQETATVRPSFPEGLVQIQLPEGTSILKLVMVPTVWEILSIRTGFLSLSITAALLGYSIWAKKPRGSSGNCRCTPDHLREASEV